MATPATKLPASGRRDPAKRGPGRRLRLDDILTLLVADGLVAASDAETLSRGADQARRASARADRRAELAFGDGAAHRADARVAGRVARRQARRAVPAHRSAEDRPHRGDADDDQRLRGALPDPAGRSRRARR